MRTIPAAGALILLGLVPGAGLNAREAKKPTVSNRCDQPYASAVSDFRSFAAKHSTCVSDEDCTIMRARCPLPCWSAVNRSSEREVDAYADTLVERLYEQDKCVCKYRCIPPKRARCVKAVCAAAPDA